MKNFLPMLILLAVSALCPALAQEVDSTAVAAPPAEIVESPSANEVEDVVVENQTTVVEEPAKSVENEEEKARKTEEEMWFVTKDELYGRSIDHSWEYRMTVVFNTSTGTSAITSDESGGFLFSLGYNLTSHLYAGGQVGYLHDFGGVSGIPGGDYFPTLGNLQLRINIRKRLSLFVDGLGGIVLPLTSDVKGATSDDVFEYPMYLYGEVSPGFMFRPSTRLDFRFSAGYAYAKPINETEKHAWRTYDETIITFKIGFAYRFSKK